MKYGKNSQSIRIPLNYYRGLQAQAVQNKRSLISELVLILDEYFQKKNTPDKNIKIKALSKIKGIVKNLPKDNYAQNMDDVLYGDKN